MPIPINTNKNNSDHLERIGTKAVGVVLVLIDKHWIGQFRVYMLSHTSWRHVKHMWTIGNMSNKVHNGSFWRLRKWRFVCCVMLSIQIERRICTHGCMKLWVAGKWRSSLFCDVQLRLPRHGRETQVRKGWKYKTNMNKHKQNRTRDMFGAKAHQKRIQNNSEGNNKLPPPTLWPTSVFATNKNDYKENQKPVMGFLILCFRRVRAGYCDGVVKSGISADIFAKWPYRILFSMNCRKMFLFLSVLDDLTYLYNLSDGIVVVGEGPREGGWGSGGGRKRDDELQD